MAELNPYRDSSPFGDVLIGSMTVPGVVVSIDGAEKAQEWEVQKATEKSGGGTVWKGQNVADSIKIVAALVDSTQYSAWVLLRKHLLPQPGQKPPTHIIQNGAINFVGITNVSIKSIGSPKWVESGGYWTGEITLIEYSPPKPANTGGAGAPKKTTAKKGYVREDNPTHALEQERDRLADEARKQGLI